MPAVCSSAPTILPGCISLRASIMVESRLSNQSMRLSGSRARTESILKGGTKLCNLGLVFGLLLPHPRDDLLGRLGDKCLIRQLAFRVGDHFFELGNFLGHPLAIHGQV